MALEKFSLEALAKIDNGRLAIAFAHELRKIELDLQDRPSVDKERGLTIKLSIKPEATEEGELANAIIQANISSTLPKRQSRAYSMKPTQGGLFYEELSLEDANQQTLEFARPRDNSPPKQEPQTESETA